MSDSGVCEVPGEVRINGETVTLRVVNDDRPEMELAYRLWYEVYVAELEMPSDAATRAAEALRLAPNGSLTILACVGDRCVGTLRMSYGQQSPEEFELSFAHLLPGRACGVLSKLVVSRSHRRTPLSMHLLIACFDYNAAGGNDQRYDTILMSRAPALLHDDYLFGFERVLARAVPHAAFGDHSFIVACDRPTNARVVSEMKRVLRGDLLMRLEWAARYQWCRLVARRDRLASPLAVAPEAEAVLSSAA